MTHYIIHCSSSHWNVQTLGFSIMGDFSYELPSQPAIDAAAQAWFSNWPIRRRLWGTILKTYHSLLNIWNEKDTLILAAMDSMVIVTREIPSAPEIHFMPFGVTGKIGTANVKFSVRLPRAMNFWELFDNKRFIWNLEVYSFEVQRTNCTFGLSLTIEFKVALLLNFRRPFRFPKVQF